MSYHKVVRIQVQTNGRLIELTNCLQRILECLLLAELTLSGLKEQTNPL